MKKYYVQHPEVPSAIKSVPCGLDLSVIDPNVTIESCSDSKSSNNIYTAKCIQDRRGQPTGAFNLSRIQ